MVTVDRMHPLVEVSLREQHAVLWVEGAEVKVHFEGALCAAMDRYWALKREGKKVWCARLVAGEFQQPVPEGMPVEVPVH